MGNTVRRVLHLIREESQVEDEEDIAAARSLELEHTSPPAPARGVHFAPEAMAAPKASGGGGGGGGGHGLLSRALRPNVFAARTLSLHNLLDHSVGIAEEPATDAGAAAALGGRPGGSPAGGRDSSDSLPSVASSRGQNNQAGGLVMWHDEPAAAALRACECTAARSCRACNPCGTVDDPKRLSLEASELECGVTPGAQRSRRLRRGRRPAAPQPALQTRGARCILRCRNAASSCWGATVTGCTQNENMQGMPNESLIVVAGVERESHRH